MLEHRARHLRFLAGGASALGKTRAPRRGADEPELLPDIDRPAMRLNWTKVQRFAPRSRTKSRRDFSASAPTRYLAKQSWPIIRRLTIGGERHD
jgi:hypothetical protein